MYTQDYDSMTDEQVVRLAQGTDSQALEYLLNKYKNFVRTKARSYFLIGADHEDIVQEGMIGLYKSIRDYKEEKLSSFRAFAELCITRQIITAIKTATRQKHIPLNSYISLNKPIYEEDSDRTLLDVITEEGMSNPEDMLIDREGGAGALHGGQELRGNRRRDGPPRQVHRQRPAAHQAQAAQVPGGKVGGVSVHGGHCVSRG